LRGSLEFRITATATLAAVVWAAFLIAGSGLLHGAEAWQAPCDNSLSGQSGLTITYPLDGTVFPPEIVPPRFIWEDRNGGTDTWQVAVRFADGKDGPALVVREREWTPSEEEWETIKSRSVETEAAVSICGFLHSAPKKILSKATVSIKTSKDRVDAPLFYREVNLPFLDAVKDPSRIRWRFGEISSKEAPPVVLEKLPVCGNCHSFSSDGSFLGMDVDYANDKGSYVLTRITKEIVLAKSAIMSWSDYKRDDGELTFGLLSQVSPNGRFAVSTVKDRSVFVPKADLDFSQLFFPIKGILAVYRRETGDFHALPGADDRQYVQSNPCWSPDGNEIVFARSKAYELKKVRDKRSVLLSQEECEEFLKDGKTFLFDLYKVPFNDGRGGKAVPLNGASNNGMSNFFPRYSPDGKWIVFCRAKSFMLLQPDSELFIVPAGGGEARRLRCNTNRMNSWHSWSPNGRWLAFASKANSPYTQVFLAHMDENGVSSPPVVLAHFTSPDRAANIPEFVNTSADAIRRIREQFVDDSSFWRAGNEHLRANDLVAAVRAYEKALELNPDNAKAHNNLGNVLRRQGKPDEALTHFSRAVAIDPDYADGHNNLGLMLAGHGRLEEAVRHYERALEVEPNYADAHDNLGIALSRLEKFEEAVAHFSEALRIAPEHVSAHNNLGVALAQQGILDEAIGHFSEALRTDPGYASAHNNLGLALMQQGRFKEAAGHFSDAIGIRPDYADAQQNLQVVEALMGTDSD
jgi:tetratricopeptide (TPR) repeat protein